MIMQYAFWPSRLHFQSFTSSFIIFKSLSSSPSSSCHHNHHSNNAICALWPCRLHFSSLSLSSQSYCCPHNHHHHHPHVAIAIITMVLQYVLSGLAGFPVHSQILRFTQHWSCQEQYKLVIIIFIINMTFLVLKDQHHYHHLGQLQSYHKHMVSCNIIQIECVKVNISLFGLFFIVCQCKVWDLNIVPL